jgi:hypothetical protein
LLFNFLRDPYEKAAEEFAIYSNGMGKKIWAVDPAARLVQVHLQSFRDFPPRATAVDKQAQVEKQATPEGAWPSRPKPRREGPVPQKERRDRVPGPVFAAGIKVQPPRAITQTRLNQL